MNNDKLFLALSIFVLIVFTVVIFLWVRTSGQAYTPADIPQTKTGPVGITDITNPVETNNLQGIYAYAQLNQRCDPNATPQVTNLLPGFFPVPPCAPGLECIVTNNGVTTGFCKATLGTRCGTIYDCAPRSMYTGPTGTTGTCDSVGNIILGPTGVTGATGTCVTEPVYCNNVCTLQPYGNLLAACRDESPFNCDATQGLVCNNVKATGDKAASNQNCYQVLNEPCATNLDCYGGICFKDESIVGSQSVCRCHGDNPIDTKICMYVDGKPCKYNQECYGGLCYKTGDNTTGICVSKFLPGETCVLVGGIDNCLTGFGCDLLSSTKTCQPIKKPDAPGQLTIPAQLGKAGALCTSYNYNGTADPYLPCDDGLSCNYDLTLSGPPGYAKLSYLQGLGICTRPTAKLGQSCGLGTACLDPGVCIQNNDGVGICSRAQYLDTLTPLTVYINNSVLYSIIGSGQSLLTYLPNIANYNTLSIQLVGGGGAGAIGFQGTPPTTGNFGGGGGGSGEVIGYIGNDPATVSPNPYYSYTDPNPDGLTPIPYQIDLTSFDWDDVNVVIGTGGIGGIYGSSVSTDGNDTILTFKKGLSSVLTVTAKGGKAGVQPIGNSNGVGGAGFNGGGAGAGGNNLISESIGGAGQITFGGQNGNGTYLFSGGQDGGKGGGLGGGRGGNSQVDTLGFSEGGGGAGGSCVNYYEFEVSKNKYVLKPTGGNGGIANGSSIIPGTNGRDFTGGGSGGGALTGVFPYVAANPGNGAKGYAILKFYNLVKDINYVGNTENIGTLPANGSTGKCSTGFQSNGKNVISPSLKEFCIPDSGYTCNTSSINTGGTFCMNGSSAVSGACTEFKLGVFIQVPYVTDETYPNDYLGAWHFINLPVGFTPTNKTRLSVYQTIDPTNIYFNQTQVILKQQNGSSGSGGTKFYYTSFSTKAISPNGDKQVNLTVSWNLITLTCLGGNSLKFIQDIKFLSSGNVGVVVNESTTINIPFTPGNPVATSSQVWSYNRAYICNGPVNTMTNTLSYTGSSNGPVFCFGVDPASIPNLTAFDNMLINKATNFVWDIDDTFNNGIAMAFVNGTSNLIFTEPLTGGINSITIINPSGISVDSTVGNSIVKNLAYTVNGIVGANINNLFWDQKIGAKNRVYGYYPNFADKRFVNLQENGNELSIGLNFNRLQDMEFFDFYYIDQDNQYKYVTAIYNPTTTLINTVESQLAGYIPDLLYQNTSGQATYTTTAIGNMDRSMYTIVQTCNT
jgi:hypothetical protein